MKVLVTGSAGFVGSHLVRALAESGREVRALVHRRPLDVGEGKVECIQSNICDYDAVEKAMDGVGIVYHCAAAVPQFVWDRELRYQVNVEGTSNILRAALKKGAKRVIFFSSRQVYGLQERCSEDTPLAPICDYGRQKVVCEKACMEYQKKGLEVVIFRLPLVTGPGQIEPNIIKVMELVRKGDMVRMPGRKSKLYHMVDVRDIATACLLAENNPQAFGQAFNLGAEEVPTEEEWVSALIQYAKTGAKPRFIGKTTTLVGIMAMTLGKLLLRKKATLPFYYLRVLYRDSVLDISKAKRVLGWKPTRTAIESAIDSYNWFVGNETLRQPERQPECESIA